MNLTVNGKPSTVDGAESLNVTELLSALTVAQAEYVTVELNGEVLEREAFDATTVKDGDSVEFLYFMGGGH
ncbi:sulfur carrier protein ThiS [Geobacter pickeringii]|uniref:Sulfur transfer protein involved in thiamine biosynthesis n=1 Tax=Geobacter pickeringii TaxID=345632 RepID=A0A0B5BCI1_9BACT|nr:sulfur carrier protein ThiS [Geobacter pickeringii]AJE02784.1 sulfur transfer protein involved in thiamine biosynthesis [Geobacter pickeringii]